MLPSLLDDTGASEGNLVWYGQPSEVQFTRRGGVAKLNCLKIQSPDFIDSRGTQGKNRYSKYRSDRTVSDAPQHIHGFLDLCLFPEVNQAR